MPLRNRQTLKRMLLATFIVLFTAMQTAHSASRYVYIHSDMLGSPMATTDERGNIISRENVTPYGDSLGKRDSTNGVAVGSPEHGPGYTGHVRDRDLGLTYMQARYYDPVIGRFIGADPVGFLDNGDPAYFNRYAYVNNNPYRFIDPTGMSTGTTGYDEIGNEGNLVTPDAGSPTNDNSNTFKGVSWNNNNVDYLGVTTRTGDLLVEGMIMGLAGIRLVGLPKRLPDSAVVCRGGTCTADRFATGTGVKTDYKGNLTGVSVNSAPGKPVQEVSQGIKNGQVGVTTVGEIRKAGGNVTASPTRNNLNHCTMCGISPQKAEELFTPTIRNPNL